MGNLIIESLNMDKNKNFLILCHLIYKEIYLGL